MLAEGAASAFETGVSTVGASDGNATAGISEGIAGVPAAPDCFGSVRT